MVTRCVRQPRLLIAIFIVASTSALAAQQAHPVASAEKDYLAAGPFLFEPGMIRPTYMDAFDDRPVAKSPDGTLGVTITGPKKSWGAWVTISPSKFPDGPVQIWPVQRNVDVLWDPDSKQFALTDNRYANRSYVLVCGTEFRMGESGEGLGVPITDLTPIIRKAFNERAGKYYQINEYETRLFYAKVLRWIGNDDLLVGISARTVGPATFPNRGQREWDFAYLISFPSAKVVREVDKGQLLSEYQIKVPY